MIKNIIYLSLLVLAILVVSCDSENLKQKSNEHPTTPIDTASVVDIVPLTFCDCLDSLVETAERCSLEFPIPAHELDSIARRVAIKTCKGEEILEIDTLTRTQLDSIEKAYQEDLSLEIKEIAAEIENPISDDCKLFLEDYASAIKSFSNLVSKIEKNPDDINLIIARGSQEDNLYSYSSKPQMFQCSQNDAFKQQVEILNNKRDKLLSN